MRRYPGPANECRQSVRFESPAFGDICDPSRPILSFSWRAEGPHRAAAHSHARAHIIYTVNVSRLLDELILRTVEYGNEYAPGGPAARLAQVMLDELATMELAPLLLPISQEPRLESAMKVLIGAPSYRENP